MRSRPVRWLVVAAFIVALLRPAAVSAVGPTPTEGSSQSLAQTEVEVKVEKVYAWVHGGKVFIAGEIRNTSRYHLNGYAQVEISPGQSSASEIYLVWVPVRNVPPGARFGFLGRWAFRHSSVRIVWSNAGGYTQPRPVAAFGISTAGDVFSDPTGLGDTVRVEIRNTTGYEIRVRRVSAVFRAANGRVSNVAEVVPTDLILLPDQSTLVDVGTFPTGVRAVRAEVDADVALNVEPFSSVVSWQDWFYDISDESLRMSIAWLAEQGITGGCSTYKYCPTASVTRAQMAMFLVRAFDLPTATGPDHFSDDNGKTGESSINALFESGITGGCKPGLFCPSANVTRAQMAIFLVRALGLPAPLHDHFSDDNGMTGESQINSLYEAGVTGGCAPGKFCPKDTATRAQMAAFLQRALALP